MADDSPIKILSDNRQASHNYFLLDRWEAGIVLAGTEVKAGKTGKIQLKDAYAEIVGTKIQMSAVSFRDGPPKRGSGKRAINEAAALGEQLAADLK